MDVGLHLRLPGHALRPAAVGETLYVDGGVNIMA
jgi:enoyl-[acyl-carrier-protein] reductase (NADH)